MKYVMGRGYIRIVATTKESREALEDDGFVLEYEASDDRDAQLYIIRERLIRKEQWT